MKIIRPENLNEFKKEEKTNDENMQLIVDGQEVTNFGKNEAQIVFNSYLKQGQLLKIEKAEYTDDGWDINLLPIEQLMQQTIDENKIKVEITLTKRQKELFDKKGGEKWLKKVLIGQTKGAKHGNKR